VPHILGNQPVTTVGNGIARALAELKETAGVE